MKYQCRIIVLAFLILIVPIACKRIIPDKANLQGTKVPLPQPISIINIPVVLPLGFLERELNKALNDLVFADDNLSLGNGIFTDLKILRAGNINISSTGDNKLLVKLPMRLKGALKIEKKVFGQVLSTSIPYDELLNPEISFSPEIGKDWDLTIQNIKIESWDRSLKYDLLGYEVDFDSILRKHLENILAAQLSDSGLSKISFKKTAEETWKAYSKPFKIAGDELDAYVYTVPQKIKINEQLTSDNQLNLNIGLEGKVMTYLGNEPASSPSPLPLLDYNEDTTNHLDITLPLAIPYSILDDYLNSELSGVTQTVDKKTKLTPKNIRTKSYGGRVLIQMEFELERLGKKDLSGELLLVGKPGFDKVKEAIVFEDIDFDINTKNILANNARWLKPKKLLKLIHHHASFPIGQYINQARSELQKRSYLSTEFASFRVADPELNVTGIYITENDVRIYLNTTGKVEVNLLNPDKLIK